MRRIGVLTSGGDAPGMNAAIRAVVRLAIARDATVVGVRHGYAGLMAGDTVPLDSGAVGGIIEKGGTILRSARCPEFVTDAGQEAALQAWRRLDLDGLVVIGGNGTQAGALALHRHGVAVVGIASTIDNDIPGSEMTIGADTALNTIVEAIDRIRDTASAHERTFVVETMGRGCGWLALHAGLATGADVVLIPEVPWTLDQVVARVLARQRAQKAHTVVVVAEGAGDGAVIAGQLSQAVGGQIRATVLGHVQRGGAPTAFDRILASRLAAAAVQSLLDGQLGTLAVQRGGTIVAAGLADALEGTRNLDLSLYQLDGVFAA
ncbi:MAG TPA: ATP-dependent 6-phosphofructokinase [bacterium]|nr:ATP-dependent 6-phosphofructokinase [bacterium]